MLSTIKKRFYMTIYTIYWTQSILTLLFVQFLTVHHSLFCWAPPISMMASKHLLP